MYTHTDDGTVVLCCFDLLITVNISSSSESANNVCFDDIFDDDCRIADDETLGLFIYKYYIYVYIFQSIVVTAVSSPHQLFFVH
jgi:hypothetical protein